MNVEVLRLYRAIRTETPFVGHLFSAPSQWRLWQEKAGFWTRHMRLFPLTASYRHETANLQTNQVLSCPPRRGANAMQRPCNVLGSARFKFFVFACPFINWRDMCLWTKHGFCKPWHDGRHKPTNNIYDIVCHFLSLFWSHVMQQLSFLFHFSLFICFFINVLYALVNCPKDDGQTKRNQSKY